MADPQQSSTTDPCPTHWKTKLATGTKTTPFGLAAGEMKNASPKMSPRRCCDQCFHRSSASSGGQFSQGRSRDELRSLGPVPSVPPLRRDPDKKLEQLGGRRNKNDGAQHARVTATYIKRGPHFGALSLQQARIFLSAQRASWLPLWDNSSLAGQLPNRVCSKTSSKVVGGAVRLRMRGEDFHCFVLESPLPPSSLPPDSRLVDSGLFPTSAMAVVTQVSRRRGGWEEFAFFFWGRRREVDEETGSEFSAS